MTPAIATGLFALAVLAAMMRDANKMNGTAPQRIRLPVALLAAAAGLYAYMAFSGWWFSWPDAVFSGAVASYVWLQRRRAS
jgi:hypothetical protein